MIKSKYVLSQERCCETGNFAIHELTPQDNQNEQESGFSQNNFAPQENIGKFEQKELSPFCCSCQRITKLSLQLYGQRLSLAQSMTNCFAHACAGELVVYSHSKVILGKIKKTCSAWCSSSVMLIEDQSNCQIFSIRMRCCQVANILPRIFNCGYSYEYQVVDKKGNIVAKISNIPRSCCTSFFTLQDDFHLQFITVEKEKEKILLLNAVVFLNHMRHQWF